MVPEGFASPNANENASLAQAAVVVKILAALGQTVKGIHGRSCIASQG
jgi:hypothetical protein